MKIEFYGVRGKFVMTKKMFSRYGGNTPCVCITSGEHRLLLDAGMGIVRYGELHPNEKVNLPVFITHYHWDHIQGFPFFPLIHKSGNIFRFYGPFDGKPVKERMEHILRSHYSPLGSAEKLEADVSFFDVKPGDSITEGLFTITAVQVPHGDAHCLAYVISDGAKRVVYAPSYEVDHTNVSKEIDSAFGGADAMIIDCTYFEAMFTEDKTYAHSTFERSMALCGRVGCRRMIPFHYYDMPDDKLDLIIKNIQGPSGVTIHPAREGTVIEV